MPIHDPIRDNEQFERYLKHFRPLAPDALFAEPRKSACGAFAVAGWAAVAVALIVALVFLHGRTHVSKPRDEAAHRAAANYAGTPRPLTVESANTLLNQAPSFEEAINAVAVSPKQSLLDRKHSAFEVLGKEP